MSKLHEIVKVIESIAYRMHDTEYFNFINSINCY